MPHLGLANRQRKVKVAAPWIRAISQIALPMVLEQRAPETGPLATLEEVQVVIVSDPAIARYHKQFMNIPGPTDVITFHHGDIIISADTALSHVGNPTDVNHELALYVVHGLMHLQGFDDHEPRARKKMHRIQETILARAIAAFEEAAKGE